MNYFLILAFLFGILPNFPVKVQANELSFVQNLNRDTPSQVVTNSTIRKFPTVRTTAKNTVNPYLVMSTKSALTPQNQVIEEFSATEKTTQVPNFPTVGNHSLEQKIINSCAKFGCNSVKLIRVMRRESGGNPKAINRRELDNPKGLFQFKSKTWSNFSKLAGFGTLDIWNEDDQILLASWAFANGYQNHWACK